MVFSTFLKSVVKVKHLDLLGETSHAKLSPPFRKALAKKMMENNTEAKKAGVLALFYPNKNNETQLVLILRKTYKGVHSAQVGFPGGKYETEDKTLETTALRETEEEIGVPKSMIEVIKKMSPLYVPPSNFMVHPYLAVSKTTPHFIKEDKEVEAIIEVSLIDILEETNIINTSVATSYNAAINVPAYKLNEHIVWGATSMMLSELKDLLKQVL